MLDDVPGLVMSDEVRRSIGKRLRWALDDALGNDIPDCFLHRLRELDDLARRRRQVEPRIVIRGNGVPNLTVYAGAQSAG